MHSALNLSIWQCQMWQSEDKCKQCTLYGWILNWCMLTTHCFAHESCSLKLQICFWLVIITNKTTRLIISLAHRHFHLPKCKIYLPGTNKPGFFPRIWTRDYRETNPAKWQGGGLEPRTPGLQDQLSKPLDRAASSLLYMYEFQKVLWWPNG